MGLAQRRIVTEFQGGPFVAWKKEFDAVCGFEVPMEVKWETMQEESYQDKDNYFAWYASVYFNPLMQVMKNICQDQMGKDALKGALKKIIIDGTEGSSYRPSTFEGGTFTLKHKFNTNVDSVEERVKGWTELFESKL